MRSMQIRLAAPAAILSLLLVTACGDDKQVFSSDAPSTVSSNTTSPVTTSRPSETNEEFEETRGADMASSLRPNAAAPASQPSTTPPPSNFSGVDIPLEFGTPEGWLEEKPSNNMRVHQYRLPARPSEAEAGEVVVFLFPGAGGRPERNLERWAGQMKGDDGGAIGEAAVRDQFDHNGHRIWSIDMTGRYATQSMTDGKMIDKPDMRFVGFVIETTGDTFFVKCLGPASTIGAWRESIQNYVLKACAPPRFQSRPGFVAESPSSKMRKAQFRLPRVDTDTEDGTLVVFFFPGGAGSVEQNIDRWTGQFAQPDGRKSREGAKIETEKVGGSTITFLDVGGTYDTIDMTTQKPVKKEDHRMLAAIIVDSDGSDSHFVRALGPKKTLERWAEEFRTFVRNAAR